MKVRIYPKSTPENGKSTLLVFRIYLNGKPFKISTGISIHPPSLRFDQVKEEVRGKLSTGVHGLNEELTNKKNILLEAPVEAVRQRTNLTQEFVRDFYFEQLNLNTPKKLDSTVELPFLEYFDFYKEKYKSIKSKNTLRQINQVKTKLQEFDSNLIYQDFDAAKWLRYAMWLVNEFALADSTIKGHAKIIKLILKDAKKEGYQVSNEIDEIKWKENRVQPFWLNWNEVLKMKSAYCRNSTMEYVRDLFIFSCLTGLRISDVLGLNETRIISLPNGYFEARINSEKTRTDYNIPLSIEALEILKKYNYRFDRHHKNTHNSYLKPIAKSVIKGQDKRIIYSGNQRRQIVTPRWKMVTNHTARRTFGRHWMDKGASLGMLSKIFGHQNVRTTQMYIGYMSQEIHDEYDKVFGKSA